MSSSSSPHRLATGVRGLDTILYGGFIVGGVYMVLGAPGTGKTVLGNQLCFSAAARGGSAVYVTLLAESHGRLLANLRSLAFFDEALVSTRIHYLSGYGILEEGGLPGLLVTLQRVVTEKSATMLVVDGCRALTDFVESEIEEKKFLQELHFFAALTGCTTVLLAGRKKAEDEGLLTLADGVIELSHSVGSYRGARELFVTKSSGSNFLEGAHTYHIDAQGFVAYPRRESLVTESPASTATGARLRFGIAEFDAMLHGGVVAQSTTLIQGPSGSGKSVFGLHFLDAAPDDPGVYFGYGSSAAAGLSVGDALGLGLSARHDAGRLTVYIEHKLETPLDVVATRLLECVAACRAKRVFVDDLEHFETAAGARGRLLPFMTSLADALAAAGATTVMALETAWRFDAGEAAPEIPAGVADNQVHLGFEEAGGEVRHVCSIGKMRRSGFDGRIRMFRITEQGVIFDPQTERAVESGRRPRRRGWGMRDARTHSDR